jgi:hypothetical protein
LRLIPAAAWPATAPRTADRGEREQDYDQAGCQAHATAEHPAGSRRRLVLLGDLDLPVGPALDHRRVIGVDQVLLGMQLLDRLIVGVGVGRVVINPDIGQERVDCHPHTSKKPRWIVTRTLRATRLSLDHP